MQREQPSHRGASLRAVVAAYLTLFFYSTQLISCGPGSAQSKFQDESRTGAVSGALDIVPFELRNDTLLPTGTPGEDTPGVTPFTADVTPSGSAAVSIPLWVPQGRLGLQPALSITYDSQSSDGSLGVGFNLAGLSRITLCPNTMARDGAPNAVDFYPDPDAGVQDAYQAAYCLDGVRLVEVGGSFRTEHDSYARIDMVDEDSMGPRAFEHRGRDGLIRTYGRVLPGTAGSRTDAMLEGHVERNQPLWNSIETSLGMRVRFAWALAAVEDRFGNRMDILYEKAPDEATVVWQRPSRIIYTQRAGASGITEPGQREVTFHYQGREDTFTGYLAGVKISRDFRLDRIQMKGPGLAASAGTMSQVLLRSYNLTYANDSISRRSLLTQVRECDGQEVCKAPVRFEWEKGSWDFENVASHPVPDAAAGAGLNAFGLGAGRTGLAYFAGSQMLNERDCPIGEADGTCQKWQDTMRLLQLPTSADRVFAASSVTGRAIWQPYLNIEGNVWFDYLWPFGTDTGHFCKERPDRQLYPVVADWDGFGQSTVTSLTCVWLAPNSLSTPAPVYAYMREGDPDLHISGTEPNSQYFLDVDGDRLSDVVWMGRHEIDFEAGDTVDATNRRVVVFTASDKKVLPSPPGHFQPTVTGIRAVDLDGSGKMSLLGMGPDDSTFMTRLSYRHVSKTKPWMAEMGSHSTTVRHPSWWSVLAPPGTFPRTFEFVDVNGDGLVDALTLGFLADPSAAARFRVQLNTGGSFKEAVDIPFHAGLPARLLSAKTEHGDFDGDGRTDLAVFKAGSPVYLLLAGPRGEFTQGVELPFSSGANLEWAHVIDVNNDGLLDITYQMENRLNVALRVSETDVLKRVHGNTQSPDAAGLTGVNYAFEYAPLSNPNPYGVQAPLFPFYERRYTDTKDQKYMRTAPETMRLVSRMSMHSNKERLRSWRYSYRDGRSDTRGLGWLGFAWRAVVDEVTGARTETTYGNTNIKTSVSKVWAPTAHLPLTEKTTVPNGADEALVTEKTWEYEFSAVLPDSKYYRQYVKREAETVKQEKATVTTTLSEAETLTELDSSGTPTTRRVLVHGANTTEQVRSRTNRIGSNIQLFDEASWVPAGAWEVVTSWQSCSRAAPGVGCTSNPDAKNVQVQRIIHGTQGQIESMVREPGRQNDETPQTSGFYLKKTFARNAKGLVESVTWEGSGAVRCEKVSYDSIDQTFVASITEVASCTEVASSTGAKNATWRYLFHPGLGVLAQSADPNDVHTRYQYDGFGRQRVVTPLFKGDAEPPGSLSIVRTFYEWDASRLPRIRTTVDTAPGVSTESITVFDAMGRPATSKGTRFDGQAVFSHVTYDALGRLLKREFPRTPNEMPTWESYEYDALNRLKAHYLSDPTLPGPGQAKAVYAYTVPGPYSTETTVTDAAGRLKKALFDFRGLLEKSTEAVGTAKEASVIYGYDAFGRLKDTYDPQGSLSSISYDQLGRVDHTEDPSEGTRYRLYNAFGEVKSEEDDAPTNPERLVTTYKRDEFGRVTSATNAKEVLSYAYDEGPGRLRQLTRATRTPAGRPTDAVVTAYVYDDFGRLKETALQVAGELFATGQEYDRYGRMVKLTYPVAETALSYTYDTRGNLQSIGRANTSQSVSQLYWSALDYDSVGRLKKARYGNGIERELRYDSRGQLRFIQATRGATNVQKLAYEYAPDGNLTARHDLMLGATETFAYDALDRLERWTVLQKCPDLQVQFGYDNTGNLLNRATLKGAEPSTILSFTGGTSGGPNAVKRATFGSTSFSYEYDHRGNQTITRDADGAAVRTIQYTPFNLPESITEGAGTVRFDYDAAGTRVRKKGAGNEEVLYAGALYQQRRQGSVKTHILKVPSPEGVIAELSWADGSSGEDVRYFLNDLHGSPDTVTDASGYMVEQLKYDPFGGRRNPSDLTQASTAVHSGSRMGFTGHEQDDEFGLINMRGRVYDPRLMRFLSVDPVVADPSSRQAYNAYSYVLNNPLRYTDPSGFTPLYGGTLTMHGGSYSTTNNAGVPSTRDMIADAYNRHMAAPEPTPFLPARDSRVPTVSSFDDSKAQAAAHHTSDIGQSAAPVASSKTSLLEKTTTAVQEAQAAMDSPWCRFNPGCSVAAGTLNQTLGAMVVYGRYAPIDQGAAVMFAVNEFVPFASAGENALSTRTACGSGAIGGCGLGALKTMGYTLMSGLALYSPGRGVSGAMSRGANLLRGGLSRASAWAAAAKGVRLRVGQAVQPMEKTLDMALDPEVFAQAVVKRYGINLRGSGQAITLQFNPSLVAAGKSRQATPTIIEFGPAALRSEAELANTISHELNHARSWLRGGNAPESTAYAAGDALEDFIRGLR